MRQSKRAISETILRGNRRAIGDAMREAIKGQSECIDQRGRMWQGTRYQQLAFRCQHLTALYPLMCFARAGCPLLWPAESDENDSLQFDFSSPAKTELDSEDWCSPFLRCGLPKRRFSRHWTDIELPCGCS